MSSESVHTINRPGANIIALSYCQHASCHACVRELCVYRLVTVCIIHCIALMSQLAWQLHLFLRLLVCQGKDPHRKIDTPDMSHKSR